MAQFSVTSTKRLNSCDPRLVALFQEVVRTYDCTVLCGHRGQAEQDDAFRRGASKKKWPTGEHNALPSRAADVAPYDARAPGGVNWGVDPVTGKPSREAIARFYFFAGFVKARALALGIKIRFGGDWDDDTFFDDQTFNDLVHYELID